jgi:hypothetical protein
MWTNQIAAPAGTAVLPLAHYPGYVKVSPLQKYECEGRFGQMSSNLQLYVYIHQYDSQ